MKRYDTLNLFNKKKIRKSETELKHWGNWEMKEKILGWGFKELLFFYINSEQQKGSQLWGTHVKVLKMKLLGTYILELLSQKQWIYNANFYVRLTCTKFAPHWVAAEDCRSWIVHWSDNNNFFPESVVYSEES